MSTSQALQDLLFVARRFKGVVDIIPELEKISSMKATIQELSSTIDSKKKERDKFSTVVDSLEKESKKVQDLITAKLAETHSEAQEVISMAKQRAEEETARQAKDRVDLVNKLSKENDELLASIESHRMELRKVQAMLKDAEENHNKILNEISKLKLRLG